MKILPYGIGKSIIDITKNDVSKEFWVKLCEFYKIDINTKTKF
jgi:hypothetical protein